MNRVLGFLVCEGGALLRLCHSGCRNSEVKTVTSIKAYFGEGFYLPLIVLNYCHVLNFSFIPENHISFSIWASLQSTREMYLEIL